MTETSATRALVIGLDGATFAIIDRMITRGELPNISRMIHSGARADLCSTIMPNSFPAWTSCITGMNPGKHGIFWSLIRDSRHPGRMRLMNTSDIGARPIWELLGDNRLHTGMINLPVTYPPTPMRGFMVTGALTPNDSNDFTYPETLRQEIERILPDYRCEIDYAHSDQATLARQISRSIDQREALILHLMETQPWDLLFAVFTESDLTQHKFWAGIDSEHPHHRRLKKELRGFVFEVYRRLDKAVGRITAAAPESTTVFIISDHGFGPFYQSFSLQEWLIRNRYLAVKGTRWSQRARIIARGLRLMPWLQRLRDRMGRITTKADNDKSVRGIREKTMLENRRKMDGIEWDKTRAYPTADLGIRLNLRGREASGIIDPGPEANLLKQEIKRGLNQLKYSNGEPIFEAVLTREEAYTGPYVDQAPDLIVPINHSCAPTRTEKGAFTLTDPRLTGVHTPTGILIACGPGIRAAHQVEGAKITDIAPTLLYTLNTAIPVDMDGEVLTDLFAPDLLTTRTITRAGKSCRSGPSRRRHSRRGEEEVKERLRSLGYLD